MQNLFEWAPQWGCTLCPTREWADHKPSPLCVCRLHVTCVVAFGRAALACVSLSYRGVVRLFLYICSWVAHAVFLVLVTCNDWYCTFKVMICWLLTERAAWDISCWILSRVTSRFKCKENMMSNFIVLSVFINGKSTVACIVLSTACTSSDTKVRQCQDLNPTSFFLFLFIDCSMRLLNSKLKTT